MQRFNAFQPLTVRPATARDEVRVAELLFGSPSEEISVVAGGTERAARLGKALFRAGAGRNGWEEIFVAARGPEVVGAMLARTDGTSFPINMFMLPGLMATVLRLYPMCQIPALLGRSLFRATLEFPIPAGSYHIAELHVETRERGRGVGRQLLEHAIRHASQQGYNSINLTTSISSPARRLYERTGFSVTDTRTAAGYEVLTGTPGRMFMQRRLR